MNSTQRIDRIAAITIAILLTAGCIVVLYPFVSALLWAVILCFVTWPTFLWGVRLLGGRRTLAATLMALLVAPFVAVGLSLADNVSHLTAVISQGLEHGPPAPPAWVADLPLVGHRLHLAWQTLTHDSAPLTTALQRLVVPASTWLLRQGVTLDTGVRYLPGADLAGGRLHGGQGLDVGCARCSCCRARHRAEVNHGARSA
jgi:predicted PurR-regulated permease PerM